jgi:uncharacterized Zn finger protein (UPF0148 family)
MTTSALPCEYCTSPLPEGAVYCGECGRAVTSKTPRRPDDSAEVQELIRLAFAERELIDAITIVTGETEAEEAARALAEHHTALRDAHLPTVHASFAATLGLPAEDPRIAAVPWSVASSNRLEDRDDSSLPVHFTATINGQVLQATITDGVVRFVGAQGAGPAIEITNLATLADALKPVRPARQRRLGE